MANEIYGQTDEEKKNNGVVSGTTDNDQAKNGNPDDKQNDQGGQNDGKENTGGGNPSGVTEQNKDGEEVKNDQDKPAGEWSGDVDDSIDDQRTLNITESDGTKVVLVMHFPSIPEAENITDAGVRMYVDANGNTIQMPHSGDLHAALMGIFNTGKVNGAIKNVDFKLFKSLERKTYYFAMAKANSFLESATNAFKR